MADPDLRRFQEPPTGAADEQRSPTDPVSWLQIEQGWQVVAADGGLIGTVAQVAGDKHGDIFDGLGVAAGQPAQIVYVPGEQVGAIHPGEVTLKITAAQATALAPYSEAPPQTTVRPGPVPLTARISSWLRKR
jgi:hypothetical protein